MPSYRARLIRAYQKERLGRLSFRKTRGEDPPQIPFRPNYWAVERPELGEVPRLAPGKHIDPWDAVEALYGLRSGSFLVKPLGRHRGMWVSPEFLARVFRAPGGWFLIDRSFDRQIKKAG